VGLQGPTGPAGPTGPVGPEGPEGPAGAGPLQLVVRDAVGILVGPVANESLHEPSPFPAVVIDVGGPGVASPVSQLRLGSGNAALHFPSNDCTGTAYVDAEPRAFFLRTQVAAGVLYYPIPPTSSSLAFQSILGISDEHFNCPAPGFFVPPRGCCSPGPSALSRAAPAGALDVSSLTPPFTVFAE